MICRKTMRNFVAQWSHVKQQQTFCTETLKNVFLNAKNMASRNIFRHFFRANFIMFVLLISNHTVFLVQFEINLHLWVFQKAHSCKLIPNWTRNCMITYTNCTPLSSILGFHVTSEKTKLKNFKFSLLSGKSHF